MISLEECFSFSELEEDEIEAIACHEHVPMVVAAEIGCQLLQTEDGTFCLECMILECAEQANDRGHAKAANKFRKTYERFHAAHCQ